MEFILWCAILLVMALAISRCLREDVYDVTLDDAIGDIPNTGLERRVSYTYLLTDDQGHVTHGAIEYDNPAEVHQHWVGPIVKVTTRMDVEQRRMIAILIITVTPFAAHWLCRFHQDHIAPRLLWKKA